MKQKLVLSGRLLRDTAPASLHLYHHMDGFLIVGFSVVLFIYLFWLCWAFIAMQAFLSVWRGRSYSSCLHGLLTEVASLVVERGCRAHGVSSCGSWVLELRLDSCRTRAYMLHNTWDLTGSGIKLASPALADGFFTTEPPGKAHIHVFK